MNKKNIFLLLLVLVTQLNTGAQTVIKMKRLGGVSVISCKVNGLKLDFIFDTGASDVSISLTEVLFMLKNGYLNKDDIIGINEYYNADGDLSEGLVVNLKEIEIEGKKLYNVKASIVKNIKAPLLLGQSAIGKLGKIQLDLEKNTLTILSSKNEYNKIASNTVKIGTQVWMTKNLDVSVFRNGDSIPQAKTNEEWIEAGQKGQPAWCYYENNPINGLTIGKLYNWYAVYDIRGLAPIGYHIPTKNEWEKLMVFYGTEWQKIMGRGWKDENKETSKISGFSALPSGYRYNEGFRNKIYWEKEFDEYQMGANWWSSSTANDSDSEKVRKLTGKDCAYNFQLFIENLTLYAIPKELGLSVRCIKD
jgi:uncharacterized protein (TIGR02145 family)